MKQSLRLIFLLFSMALLSTVAYGQKAPKALISIKNEKLFVGMDNPVGIIAQQEEPVSIEQVKVFFYSYKAYVEKSSPEELAIYKRYEYFYVHPKETGLLEFRVEVDHEVDTIRRRVEPIQAVGRLSRHGANSDEKISAGEMKAQQGLWASLEDYTICANCIVVDYEVIRISANNMTEKAFNKGARFEGSAKLLIEKAQSGDIYIFRKIRYLCPGDKESKRLDDMIFDIK